MLSYFSKNKIPSQIPFESNDFLFRWKKIERVVSKQNVDGLLLIAGPDGNSNIATTKLINWLFLGHSGELIKTNSYLPNNFHELIVFISKNSIIFLPPNVRKQLNPYVYTLPNMTVFSPTQAQYQNGQKFSVLKISQFYKMVKDHKKIGVLGDPKQIQKWPLIQSFALQQIGGTFFTLKFNVQNIIDKVETIYKNHDKHSLKTLSQISSKRMQGYMAGTTSVLQNTFLSKRRQLTEIQLNDPINQAIQIQQLQHGVGMYSKQEQLQASSVVLIGQRTNDSNNQSGQTQIGENLHFTIDYSDPNTRLRVCRTYFLSLGTKLFEELIQQQIPQEETFIVDKSYTIQRKVNSQYLNTNILVTLYSNLIQATLESIIGITKDYRNLNTQYIKSIIVTRLSKILRDIYSFFPMINIQAELFSYNSVGELQKIDFKDIVSFKLTPHYHIIKTSIKDIPSHDNQKQILGSVIFSQSFVLQEGCYMLFTNNIPYFDIFHCQSTNSVEIYDNLNPSIRFEQLKEILDKPVSDCKLFIQNSATQQIKNVPVPAFNISIHFHQNGLRIYNDKLGWIVIPYDYMKELKSFNNLSGYWIQVSLIDNLILSGYSSNEVILGLTSRAQQLFEDKIKSSKESLLLQQINELPLHLAENAYFMKLVTKNKDKDQGLIINSQVVDSQFLFSYLESKQIMILNGMRDLKLSAFRLIYNKPDASLEEKQLTKPHLILVNGTYGAGKNRFANNLQRYGRQNRFQTSGVFTISSQNLQNKLEIPVFISMLEQYIADQPKRGSSVTIVVVPCWINFKLLLESISNKFHIRCVCTKINASNFYSTQNYQLTDNTLAYCTSGYSQFVFLDTFGQDQEYLNQITNIVWSYTPESKVCSIENNSVSSGIARDIFSCDKYMKESQVFLRSRYGVLYQLSSNDELKYLQIRYPVKLVDAISKLKEQDGYLYSPALIEKQLQKQKTQAQNSKDELLITLYKIRQRILIEKRKGLSMKLQWLKGNLRFLEQKQIQEITWTPMFYRQKQNKNAQVLGLSVLANKWNQHEFRQFIDSLSEKSQFIKKLKPQLTVDTITPQEIKALERHNRSKYLENGEFFDGTFYRDCEGTILKSHPKLQLLVKDYIQLQNLSRSEENELVKSQWEIYKNSFKK